MRVGLDQDCLFVSDSKVNGQSGRGIQRSAVVLAEVGDAAGAILMTDNDIICR